MIRTRFAPSPTGSLHVGGARTALYNYLFAKKNQGTFVLRIEDTDMVRSTEASEAIILRDLNWLGLKWDEGPGIEGKFGPYRQSERLAHYEKSKNALLQIPSLLYRCYCTEDELKAKRALALKSGITPIYDGACRKLTSEQNKPFAWRFNVEAAVKGNENRITVSDLIRGEVHFDSHLIGDFVVIKSNGFPSYNFACVVDDHGMEITHVIRGDEHLTNTPRQILLYRALGWELPQFAHLSMILAPDHSKLSKRHGTTAVEEFKNEGYLPHAIINYIALLGWSPKDERELFLPDQEYATTEQALAAILERLGSSFSLEGVSKSPAVFDKTKLSWMNAQYIRRLSLEELVKLTLPLFPPNHPPLHDKLMAIFSTQRNNFETLMDAVRFVNEFLEPPADLEESAKEVLTWPWTLQIVAAFEKELKDLSELTPESVPKLTKQLQTETGKKGKELFWPIRVAVTGKTHGPELVHLFPILGKEQILARIEAFKRTP